MLLVKAPLRISISGGGTDLASYYSKFESTFISAAINRYIYVSIHSTFFNEIILKYSEMEKVQSIDQIKHPIIRTALQQVNAPLNLEICSFADIPAGTGLGSSSSFTVALLKALYTYKNINHHSFSLAEDACHIEIDQLQSPIGKQDQYIASIGGLTKFHINKTGEVSLKPFQMQESDKIDLEEHLLLFFTGLSRSANQILQEQNDAIINQIPATHDPSNEMLQALHMTTELGLKIEAALEQGNLTEFGHLMNVHWEYKKKRSKNMTSEMINYWYQLARNNGAIGGKLIGAGGGGFLMFLADDKRRLRKVLRDAGMYDVPFRFDHLGAQVLFNH